MTADRQARIWSYDHGVSKQPLVGQTLGAYFDKIVEQHRQKEALVSLQEGERLTYGQLSERIDQFARGLMALGIEAGDRIGIWAQNNSNWVVTQMAASQIGAILVNINPAFRKAELQYVSKHAGVKLIVLTSQIRDIDVCSVALELIEEGHCPSLKNLVAIGQNNHQSDCVLSFERVVELGGELPGNKYEDRKAFLQFDEPINIQYTSGTTGFPKGVTLSHHNLLNNALFAAQAMQVEAGSRFCVPMPFYHCAGMVLGILVALLSGATIVIPAPVFDADLALTAVEKEKCTHLSGVPTMFISELEHPRLTRFDLKTLKSGFMAGAPCPVKLMHDVAEKMNLTDVLVLYGLTEASPVITASKIEDAIEKRAKTVGVAQPHCEVKIVDPITNKIVLLGEQGEICARGYMVMLGYWEDQFATVQAIDQAGWLHTGDLGTMDEYGYVHITGRKKDMIIRGGENIYPREIEEILHRHEAVVQAQVFGVPDEHKGEEVACWVQLKDGVKIENEELKAWLSAELAYFKIPRYWKFVSDFPLTVTGKVQKFAMREQMVSELNLISAASIKTA